MSRAISPTLRLGFRILAVMAVVGVFAALTAAAITPRGQLVMKTDLIKPAPFVSAPKPAKRLEQLAGGGVAFSDTPFYLDVAPPSVFDSVEMKVRYRNAGGAWLEAGAMVSALDGKFDMKPLDARLADTLPWSRLTSGRQQLLQRERQYASIESFTAESPETARVAELGSTWQPPISIVNYRPSAAEKTYRISLRGSQRILAYVGGETLHFSFVTQDMNRQVGADPVAIAVYRPGETEPLARALLADDGNATDDQHSSRLRPIGISVAGLAAGVYQLELETTDDMFIRELSASTSKFVFAGRIYLGDHVGFSDRTDPVTVYASGQRLEARTGHPESLQAITINGVGVTLAETNAHQAASLPLVGPGAVTSPKADVILETDGVIALTREAWFAARPAELSWYTTADDLTKRNIGYLFADYLAPQADGDASVASVNFSVKDLDRTATGAYRFVVHAPEVEFGQTAPVIDSVEFVWTRQRLSWAEAWARLREHFGLTAAASRVTPVGRSFDESPD